ncbi:titin [Ochlerotatus camptorhynchus]|uniref:titin n=1 Tax=Ochlerotatus camptorhynchus TaxID=644619 RepID=UPI0031CDBF80
MMERFAINILHKRIHKICRLCGVDQPHKIPIIDGAETIIVGDEDEEASLAKKIEECVGIQVCKDDKMPQNICSLCVDKINDFYEYRLMCAATNLQTRTILNLNLVEPTRKLLNFGELPKLEPSVKEEEKKDVKKVVEVATSSSSSISPSAGGKKGKKKRGPPSPSPSPGPTTRIKAAVDVKDEPVPAVPVKALTKKERLKQLQQQKEKEEKKQKEKDEKKKKEDDKRDRKEDKHKKEKVEEKPVEVVEQKHTRSKRKEPSPSKEVVDKVEPTVPPPKKIKFEHPCSYCSDEFKTQTELDGHLGVKHLPMIRKFGCGSCRETFETILESKDHNLWHQLTRTLYTCFKCKRKYDKNMALVKHMALNACGRVARGRPPTLLPDIQCRFCNKKFKTQNLYEWHGCFLKPKANCPKCGKYFVKKQILTRHYMMFCTGTLPPPEPVIVPKAEPIDPAEKPSSGSSATANPERRTRRAVVVEPDLPKEEREIPFPPPLELAPDAPAAPSASKKKTSRKVSVPDATLKPATPAAEAEKFASLLTSGAKLDRDTDIATINNLLSSVTEAIASISEAKAKKKKKKKDKNKERAPTPAVEVPKDIPEEIPPPAVETPAPAVEIPSPVVEAPPPVVVDDRTEEEVQAYELAQEVGGMTLDQQLAFCAGKLPIVVLAKTTFKQECTEIDTEPSQLQEPMDDEDADQTVENGAQEDNGYDDAMDNYSGFQNEDDDESAPEDEAPSLPAEVPTEQEHQQTEELPFPMPIKQEIELEEPEEPELPSATTEAPQQEETAPPVEATKELEKEPLFDEQLAVNIKKEPGLEDDLHLAPAAKRKRPESRSSAAASPASSLSSSQSAAQSSPKPLLILKIKKEKGLLNSSVEAVKQIRTIVLDDDDDEEEAGEDEVKKHAKEPEPEQSKKKVYKKPNSLAVRIKQEKIDPAYERQEQIVANPAELPGGIRIKQERLDHDEAPPQPGQEEQEKQAEVPPPPKKSRSSYNEKPASPIIAFDGIRIKREKPDVIEPPVETPSVFPVQDPKPPEKKKKSKVKINPFALLRQKMAAEAAAKSAATESALPPQAPSPLPVITNVVGNASTPSTSTSSNSLSGENTPIAESETEPDRTVPVIAQVTSMAAEKTKANEPEFPIAIKQEPMDDEHEQAEVNQQPEEAKEERQTEDHQAVEDDFSLPIKEESPEETAIPDESPEEPEEPEFPMPIKEELDEESHQEEATGSPDSSEKEETTEEQVTENESAFVESEKEKQNEAPDQNEEKKNHQEEANGSPESSEKEETIVTENDSASVESENEAPDQNEEETNNQEDDSPQQIPKEIKNPSPAETEKDNDDEMEPAETADHAEDAEQNNEQELENQHLPESIDEPENSTSPISDIPMDEYDQNSQEQEQPVPASNENIAPCESPAYRKPETSTEPSGINNEANKTPVEAAPQSPDHQPNVVEESPPSEPPAAEQVAPVAEHSSTVNPTTPLESDLQELQNLLTEGLKPLSVQDYDSAQLPPDSSSSTSSGEQNMIQNSSTVPSVGNDAAISALDDDLESLLNNKIEEISDQFRQPAPVEHSTDVAPHDELNLAIERELLHEMIPVGTDNGLRTEMIQMPNSTASDHSNNTLLEVERNLLLEGTGSSDQQPS